MKTSLVPYLRCPMSGETLTLVDARVETEVVSGRLVTASGREYPIDDGVPVLLDPATFAPGQAETRASFSEKWKRAPGYREDTRAHYERWYLERYGHGDIAGLTRFLAGKRFILDAGTGHGRDTEMYAKHSQAQVFGIDLSEGIHLAYGDLHTLPNVHLVQADLQRLPFAPGFFDFVACDQVIHHTPDTRASFEALLRHVAPGGHIAIYAYKVKGPIREFSDTWIRERTTAMSPEECMAFSESMTKLGKALSDLHVTVDVPEDIPLLGISKGPIDVQRFIYWHMMKVYWNDTMDWTSNAITNFDWYHPLHAHRHTPDELRAWCAELGVEIEHFDVVESGISVRGRKQA
jgi:arsenite methyltransferase